MVPPVPLTYACHSIRIVHLIQIDPETQIRERNEFTAANYMSYKRGSTPTMFRRQCERFQAG
jgi:hypothetical protein